MDQATPGGPPGPAIRFPPPLVFLVLLGAGLAADHLLGLPHPRLHWLSGAIPILLGSGLLLAANRRFRRAGEDPLPWTPTDTIIDTGIYAHTRNPMYLGMALIYLGIAVLLASLGAVAFFPAAVLLTARFIRKEEAYLRSRLGEPYQAYCRKVRRWL